MNIRLIYPLVLAIFCILATHTPAVHAHLISGTLAFPASLKSNPMLRIYYGGHIIPYETHPNKKVSFWIPAHESQTTFYVLVTKSVGVQTKQRGEIKNNTIDYLKVPEGQAYKLYELELVQELPEIPDEQATHKKQIKKIAAPTYHWNITEQTIDTETQRIPDETVIVCYFPEYIENLSGGSALELPTVTITPNIVQKAGSEEKLHEASTTLVLASIDTDTIHNAPEPQATKQGSERILIAPTL